MINHIFMTYGRFNPITKAHEFLFDQTLTKTLNHKNSLCLILTSSTSRQANKNPLTVDSKVKFIESILKKMNRAVKIIHLTPEEKQVTHLDMSSLSNRGNVLVLPAPPNVYQFLSRFDGPNITLHLVLGSDRGPIEAGGNGFAQYFVYGNNKPGYFKFKKVSTEIIKRNPHDTDLSHLDLNTISGTKLRQAAKNNDFELFKKLAAGHLDEIELQDMFDKVRARINLKESLLAESLQHKILEKLTSH